MDRVRKRQGFTLIELLVVIAIISLLLAIVMPSLQAAKKKASMILCLSNQRSLVTAWQTYTIDNDSEIVPGYVWSSTMKSNGGTGAWVEPPQDTNGTFLGQAPQVTLDERYNGFRKGLLFPYLDSVKVFHCPGDTRIRKGTSKGSNYTIYRTYSVPDGIIASTNGSLISTAASMNYAFPYKTSQMFSPANKYIMIEESYDGGAGNFNDASWNFDYNGTGKGPTTAAAKFWDPLALYHKDSCTIGYADAHAETYKFKDPHTIEYFKDRDAFVTKYGTRPDESNNEDVTYFRVNWPGIPSH